MQRRNFLATAAAGLGALAGWPAITSAMQASPPALKPLEPDIVPDGYQPPDWLRYSRTIYFDGYAPPLLPHIKDFDAARLVATVTELGGDTLRFQPIGLYAYYPSKAYIPHPELGGRDLIDEVSRECRRRGIHHYCYCTYCGALAPEFDNNPMFAGWVLRDPEGKPAGISTGYGNRPQRLRTCGTGDFYRQQFRKLVQELCAHDMDGVYFDAPSGYRGVCFCEDCQQNFKKFSGMDIYRLRDARSEGELLRSKDMEALNAWYDWANQLTDEDLRDIRKIIHGSGKFMLCHNGATWRPGSYHARYRYSDGFMVEYSDQFYQRLLRAMMGAAMARPTKKLAQTYMGGYDVTANNQPPHSKPWALHIMDLEDSDEIRMEGFADLAGGNVPLYGVANRLLFGLGSGSTDPAKEVYALMRHAEALFKDSVPVPYVSLVLTAESIDTWRTKRQSWNMMMSESFALAMLDERISFDVNPNTELTPEWLKTQKVVALLGASALPDKDAALLSDWVKQGGSLFATYDSGLYDEKCELRQDGGALKDVLGVEMKGEPLEGIMDSYYRVNSTHPALGEYGKGSTVLADSRLVPVKVSNGATDLADLWVLDTEVNRGPGIVVNSYGRGRAIYVSGSLEAMYMPSRVASIQRMLGSMVRYLGENTPVPFSLVAPKGVYGILRRSTGGDLVLWVCANVGFKGATVGRMRQDFVPVSNVQVKVLVPEGRQVKSVDLLRSKQTVPFTIEGGYAELTLPVVHIAEVVHLNLA
jgi:hypothetical protein